MAYLEEDDSYLKKGMKDEAEKYPRIKKTTDPNFYVKRPTVVKAPPVLKGKPNIKTAPPVLKKGATPNKKKAALGSMLGSLSSGANFRNG